jgi:hypothetical protein
LGVLFEHAECCTAALIQNLSILLSRKGTLTFLSGPFFAKAKRFPAHNA